MKIDPTAPVRPRARTPAERMRSFRRRRRFKRLVVRVELEKADIQALIQRGYLASTDCCDLVALEAAANFAVSDLLGGALSQA